MGIPPRSRSYNQFPYDETLNPASKQCLDWLVTQINQLVAQATIPPIGTSLGTFGPNIIDPTSAQVKTGGSRTSSICTALHAVATPTTITLYWDGTNGSQPFKIYRDDGTVFGPFITGSGPVITGLVANTTYYIYPYFDETLVQIGFATVAAVSVGSPGIAFTAQNNLAAQQQILRNRLPLAFLLSSVGITTPNVGFTNVNGGSGGGGAGVGGSGKYVT